MIPAAQSMETARLTLRPPIAADFDAFAEAAADPEVMHWLGGARDRATAWRLFAVVAGHWSLFGYGPFSVVERESNLWIGRIGPWTPEGSPGHEFGWLMARPFWGRGFAREAVHAGVDHALGHLGWPCVRFSIAPGNDPAIRLAEDMGGQLEKVLDHMPGIGFESPWRVYRLDPETWRMRAS